MKNRKYKLFNEKKYIKTLSNKDEINSLRKELLLLNATPIVSGVGSICLNTAAFNLDQLTTQARTPIAVCGALLGAVCVGGLVATNSIEETKQIRDRIKELKLKRKELNKKR